MPQLCWLFVQLPSNFQQRLCFVFKANYNFMRRVRRTQLAGLSHTKQTSVIANDTRDWHICYSNVILFAHHDVLVRLECGDPGTNRLNKTDFPLRPQLRGRCLRHIALPFLLSLEIICFNIIPEWSATNGSYWYWLIWWCNVVKQIIIRDPTSYGLFAQLSQSRSGCPIHMRQVYFVRWRVPVRCAPHFPWVS